MTILIDKLILLLCCVLLMSFSYTPITFTCILGFLTAFCISCLYTYINPTIAKPASDRKTVVSYTLICIYLFLCLMQPIFCIFLPLIFYDIAIWGNRLLGFLALSSLIYPITAIDEAPWDGAFPMFVLVIFMALAYYLAYRTKQLFSLREEFKAMRDYSRESNLHLVQKNRDLMEKQDYEIYLVTLKERNRIAREIHDNVGHMLSRSLLQIGALLAISKESPLTEPLHALKDTLSGAMDSIRSSVHDLHDDSFDLETVVNELLKDFTEYQIKFDFDMSKHVPRNVKYCFLSMIKEGLSNISKHSNANHIHLVLREHPSIYQLLLEDNGTGSAIASGGIGLENMKERTSNLNGSFLAEAKAEGFRIFATIPVQEGDL